MEYGYADIKNKRIRYGVIRTQLIVNLNIKNKNPNVFNHKPPQIGSHYLHITEKLNNDRSYKTFVNLENKKTIPRKGIVSILNLGENDKKVELVMFSTKGIVNTLGVKIGYTKNQYYTKEDEFLVPDIDEHTGKFKGYYICKRTKYDKVIDRSIESDVEAEKVFFAKYLKEKLKIK